MGLKLQCDTIQHSFQITKILNKYVHKSQGEREYVSLTTGAFRFIINFSVEHSESFGIRFGNIPSNQKNHTSEY